MKNTHDPDGRPIMDQQAEENEMVSSPIGRLMSDDTEPAEEQSSFVSGFERNQPALEEPPAPAERRRPRPERPASSADTDEDFFEAGIREARAGRERDRERRRKSNPDPKPAVRATVPTTRRMTGPLPRRGEEAGHSTGSLPEDKYDTFRQRYNPDDLISAGRGGRPPARRGTPPPRGGSDNRGRDRDFDNDGGDPNLVRWLAVGGVLVLLILLVIMTVGRTSASRRYNEAAERIVSMEAAYAESNSLRRQVDSLEATLRTRDNRITYLENQLDQQDGTAATGDGAQQGTTGQDTGTTGTDEAPPNQDDFPRTHVVQAGQNLTRIARIHYGDGTGTENHLRMLHIAAYNNIAYPFNVSGGQSITIPPPPAP